MKKITPYYKVFDSYCVRTPLFSFSNLKNIVDKPFLKQEDFEHILQNPVFKEALFLASPELHNQIVKWETGVLKDAKKIKRLYSSILKYFTRISSRCTPFGLFASCNAGKFGATTTIDVNNYSEHKRSTRFDTTFLALLLEELLKDTLLIKELRYYPNTSIYKVGNHYRYIEYTIKDKNRNYSLEGIKYSEYLSLILEKAKEGHTISQLGTLLVDEEITQEAAESFIKELITHQILVSELELTVTGTDYLENLLKRLQGIPTVTSTYKKLVVLKELLNSIDRFLGNSLETYSALTQSAKNLVPEFNAKFLYQTDSFSSFSKNTLSYDIQNKLLEVLEVFNKITLTTASATIERFKEQFLKRFEQDEIPLTTALDADAGVGYRDKKYDNASLLDELLPIPTKKRYERIIWSDVDTIMQRKLVNALAEKKYSISLTKEDFKELPTNWNNVPDTISAMVEIYTVDKAQQLFIKGVGGASATNLIGRFSYGNKELLAYVKEIANMEAQMNPNKILAEIVHLPQARTGNILQRPSFRAYEIPYLGKSTATPNCQIPIDDILVSVRNDTIVLRSKKLHKEILPRLGNAHNFGAAPLPIYQFLCELQTQNKRSSIGFSWNSIFKKQAFLPRVVFKDVIFSKARWNILVSEFKKISDEANGVVMKSWQKEQKMPNYVELVDGDNRLFINLQNTTSVKMLFETIKKRTYFILEEFLYPEDDTVTDTKDQAYRNQFVVSYYNYQKLKENE